MSSSNIRRIDGNKVKRGDLITLKKNVDEELNNIMKTLEDLKNNVDHKLDALINMLPEEKAEKITSDQIWYIKILYENLGEEPPDNLEEYSKKEASRLIKKLKKRLGW